MVSSLSKNYQKAVIMSLIAEEYYAYLMREARLTAIGLWEVNISRAEMCQIDDGYLHHKIGKANSPCTGPT